MPHYQPEERERAAKLDLLTYLQTTNPGEVIKTGPHEYRTRTHSSLVMSNGRWKYFAGDVGGVSSLDYYIKVEGMHIADAIHMINGASGSYIPPANRQEPKHTAIPFFLPAANSNHHSVIRYLQGRGIDREIIDSCIAGGILYESQKYSNCIFVGRDKYSVPRFASLRGTLGSFKRDAPGSNKRHSFVYSPRPAFTYRAIAVFESPIDALSFATLQKMKTSEWVDCLYLSLSGTSPLALMEQLSRSPEITQVHLRLDNDKAGVRGMERIAEDLQQQEQFSHIATTIIPLPSGKDYSEYLMQVTPSSSNRFRTAISKQAVSAPCR